MPLRRRSGLCVPTIPVPAVVHQFLGRTLSSPRRGRLEGCFKGASEADRDDRQGDDRGPAQSWLNGGISFKRSQSQVLADGKWEVLTVGKTAG